MVSQKKQSRRANKALFRLIGATLCIIFAVALWVLQAEKFQELNKEYNQPYFVSYIYQSSYALLYIVWKVWILLPGNCCWNKAGEGSLIFNKKLVLITAILAILRTVDTYFWNLSLPRTNIPANTAIYQSAAAFVFIISIPLLKERVTFLKVFCVLLSICGVALVSFYSTQCKEKPAPTNETQSDVEKKELLALSNKGDPCAESSTPIGYVVSAVCVWPIAKGPVYFNEEELLIIAIIAYALFETFYKKFATVKDDPASLTNGIRCVGYIGVHSMFWLWPPILILHFSKLEEFHWPSVEQLELILLGCVSAILYVVALVTSIGLVSPLFTTVGTILSVPTSVITDWIVQGELLVWQAFVGVAFIIFGFCGFTFSEFIETRREQKAKQSAMSQINSTSDKSSSEDSPLLLQSESKQQLSWRRRIIDNLYWI